jgi:hypothetical protein
VNDRLGQAQKQNTMKAAHQNSTTPIIRITLEGELDKEKADSIFREIERVAEKHERYALLNHIKDFDGFESVPAFFETMSSKFKVGSLAKPSKYAVVSDRDWVEFSADMVNILWPGLEVQQFDEDEMDEAVAWLRTPRIDDRVGIQVEATEGSGLLRIVIDGKLGKADIEHFNSVADAVLGEHGSMDLYMEVRDLEGITWKALWADMKSGFKYFGRIDHVAISGDDDMRTLIGVTDFLTPGLELEFFESKGEALQWLSNRKNRTSTLRTKAQ